MKWSNDVGTWVKITELESEPDSAENNELQHLKESFVLVICADYQQSKLIPYWGPLHSQVWLTTSRKCHMMFLALLIVETTKGMSILCQKLLVLRTPTIHCRIFNIISASLVTYPHGLLAFSHSSTMHVPLTRIFIWQHFARSSCNNKFSVSSSYPLW